MAVQAWIVMTATEKDMASILDDENAVLGAREIVNALADDLGYNTLVGKWVAPARILKDPDYTRWVASLGSRPIHVMDSDTLFFECDPSA